MESQESRERTRVLPASRDLPRNDLEEDRDAERVDRAERSAGRSFATIPKSVADKLMVLGTNVKELKDGLSKVTGKTSNLRESVESMEIDIGDLQHWRRDDQGDTIDLQERMALVEGALAEIHELLVNDRSTSQLRHGDEKEGDHVPKRRGSEIPVSLGLLSVASRYC